MNIGDIVGKWAYINSNQDIAYKIIRIQKLVSAI